MNTLPTATNKGQIAIYQSDNSVELDVLMENETVWLTQAQIAELFGTKRPAVTKHLINIYKSGELEEMSTCSILEHMGNNASQTYQTRYYNLDAILSIGYRVNSKNATQFRIWANKVLKEYLVKGYAVNEKFLKEKNAELITQLQALSMLIINEIPLTKEMAIDMMVKTIKND